MPADFIEVLNAAIALFETTIAESSTAKIERVGTNAGFEDPVKDCKEGLETLDPIVKMVYRNNPQKLAEWLVASHVERHTPIPRKPKTPDEPKSPTP